MHNLSISDISKAIRKNGLEQRTGAYYSYGANHEYVAACAIGQAAVNLNKNPFNLQMDINYLKPRVECPYGPRMWGDTPISCPTYDLGDMITHLNDIHRLTFEEIADYLDSIEVAA